MLSSKGNDNVSVPAQFNQHDSICTDLIQLMNKVPCFTLYKYHFCYHISNNLLSGQWIGQPVPYQDLPSNKS